MNVLEVHILQDRMQEIWGNRNPFTYQILRDKFKTTQGRKEFFDDNWKILNDAGIFLGRYNDFEKLYGGDSPWNCICYKTKLFKTTDPNTVVNEKGDGEQIYFYNNYKVFYFKKDGGKVKGIWKCEGEEDYSIQFEDGTTYSSKVGGGGTNSGGTTKPKIKYKQNDATLEDVLKGKKLVKRLDKGDIVKQIQEKLGKIYTEQLKGVVDSKFGKKTKAAVIIFQRKNGLVDDGIVGEFTAKALFGSQPDTTPTETVDDINVPYRLSGSFTTSKGAANALDKAHNLKGLETELDKILPLIYNKKINPKITNIDFDITDNGNSYVTSYSVTIDKSNDRKAWVGFTSRGSAGQDYVKRADGQITGSENADGKSLEQKLQSIGAGEIQIFEIDEKTSIPYKQYFVQFTKPEKFPPHQVNESNLKKDIKKKLVERLNEKKLIEDIVEKRLDYLLSQLKETKNYKNINQYKRSKLFIDELNELKSCGLL